MKIHPSNKTMVFAFLRRTLFAMIFLLATEICLFAAEKETPSVNSGWILGGVGFASGILISAVLYWMGRSRSAKRKTFDQKNSEAENKVAASQKDGGAPCSQCDYMIPGKKAPVSSKKSPDSQGTILIVEDDQVCLDMMVAFLNSKKYDVLTAKDGFEALKLLETTVPELVILDLVMPGKSGFEVCRDIRKRYSSSQLPVIMLTVQNRLKDILKGFQLGANDYLIKPIANKELMARVKTHILIGRSDQKLRESEEKYRQFFENVFDFWFVHDLEGHFVETNLNLKKEWGYNSPGEALRNIHDLISPTYHGRIKDYIKRVVQHEKAEGIVPCYTYDRIEKFMNYRSVLIKNDEGNPMYIRGTARDVTERITAKREKNELEKQIRQSQKMEAIGSLAGGIAHDFNNTLFPIVGYTEMALSLTTDESPIREYLEEVLQASTRATKLIDQILAFSRKQESAPRSLHMQPMLKESIRMLQASLPSTIRIRHQIESHEDHVMGDPVQIHQMLMNLCTNAYQAMGEGGGVLEIRLLPISIDPVKDELWAKGMKAGPYYHLRISDTGCGISPELVDRIFDPYFSTKGNHNGSGIGLTVVHQIIQRMRGTITVSSRVGTGTTFDIFIPRIKSEEGEETLLDADKLPGGRERILLVDDEHQIVKMMRRMIEPLGYNVTVRYSSLDALEAFRAAPDQYHLVLTDQTMPNMTGIMLCQQIRKIRPDVRLILCSGQTEPSPALKPLLDCIDGYIKKPIRHSHLALTLRNVLDGRSVKPFDQSASPSCTPAF